MVFLSLSSNRRVLAVMEPMALMTDFFCFRHSSRFSSKSCQNGNDWLKTPVSPFSAFSLHDTAHCVQAHGAKDPQSGKKLHLSFARL